MAAAFFSQHKIPLMIAGVAVLIVLTTTGVFGVYHYYSQRALPGTTLAGVDLSHKTYQQITQALAPVFNNTKGLKLVWGTYTFTLPATELGLRYDSSLTATAILEKNSQRGVAGTISQLIQPARQLPVEPVFELNGQILRDEIASISAQLEIPAQEPQISLENGQKVVVLPGENGQEVNQSELEKRILAAIRTLQTSDIEIPVVMQRPKLSDEKVQAVLQRANSLLGKQLTVTLPAENLKWDITTEQIIGWIDLQGESWKEADIKEWVRELSGSIDRPAQNASFRVTEQNKVEEFKPEKPGLVVEQPRLVQDVLAALSTLATTATPAAIEVKTVVTKPDIATGEVNNLGIRELIGKGESWYAGSITNRIFNLKKAAEALDGTLIPPGDTFSFNKVVGEISQATGYKSAFIIKDGKTILGDGGGVCQTSSTLFRAVLNAGLPIEERAAHAYRVSYYEQNYQPGFDATIFQPAPDFRFKNDTPGHVLIQMVFDESKKYLSFELYGTSDGRKAEVSKARVWDVVAPPPDLYIDDPTLPVGQVKQTEHAARGAKVAFDWKVTRGDEVLQERTFYSNYRAWQGVYMRGTKVN